MKIRVRTEGKFSSAHLLPDYPGECVNLHGHTWKYELSCSGMIMKNGMVIDFNFLKEFDHKFINNIIKNPTAENILKYFVEKIKKHNKTIHIFYLRIFEDPLKNEYVEYSDEV